MRMHPDQIPIDAHIARALISEQFPEWADLEVTAVSGSGTVNAIFRVGQGMAARFPLQRAEPDLARRALEQEAAAMTEFASASPVASPIPVALGRPGGAYPMPWSVQTWLDGDVATPISVATSTAVARDLADLIQSLRAVPTRGRTFRGTGRGGDLRAHDAYVQECLTEVEGFRDAEPLRALWSRLRGLPDGAAHVMTHSDLTPWNILIDERVRGVLDAGCFGPADPSLDLVCAWHHFDAPARAVLRDALSADELAWQRGAAWAFQQAVGLVWYYRTTNPPMAWLGETTLARLLADDDVSGTR
ncbi:phosphotransferase [Microbacterium terricola]|uniref:Phosphotransferase n=1 Tax=Microbacterium terricola TaxID=344163 RepID=A0ABM8E3E2_9MICO|nr:phosphotransferase [Microbacterium terricola]UYK39988.1 phosphotransferase [Microbacterium terricola]BDV32325.1 putative phosphotransferase [Microbacterium terricola]